MRAEAAGLSTPQSAAGGSKKIWLTFDDGPHPRHTEAILDVLKAKAKSATFFVLGSCVNQVSMSLLERALDEGHRIGNHSFSHRRLTELSMKEIRHEIASTEALIGKLLGAEKLFRPPYGSTNARADRAIRALGYRKVLWNVNTLDWIPAAQPDWWVEFGVNQVSGRASSVVLAHDVHQRTADHLAYFIERVERLGDVSFESCETL
jgi:peptidoglycan/xylan/chitin deacetylase (PgdA/CDA1 family)